MPGKTCPCILSLACLTGRLKNTLQGIPRPMVACPRCGLTIICINIGVVWDARLIYVRVPCTDSLIQLRSCVCCRTGATPYYRHYDLTTEEDIASFREKLQYKKRGHGS